MRVAQLTDLGFQELPVQMGHPSQVLRSSFPPTQQVPSLSLPLACRTPGHFTPLLELSPKVVVCAVVLWRMDARLRAVRRVEVGEGMVKDDVVDLNSRQKILGLTKQEKESGYIYYIDQGSSVSPVRWSDLHC